MKIIPPAAYEETPSSHVLIDVRTPVEFAEAHIRGARLHPLDDLSADNVRAELGGRPALVTCLSGGRARKAAEKLEAAGVEADVLEGGLIGWEKAGLPVVRGTPKGMPLFRQVLLTVGLINLAAGALALGIDVRWAWVPVLTGCGMILSGATGFCGMALLLAKMPWNRP
jgi:rhodanese-related sulfurtransferase